LRFAAVIDEHGKRLVEVGEAAPNQGWLKSIEGIGGAPSYRHRTARWVTRKRTSVPDTRSR